MLEVTVAGAPTAASAPVELHLGFDWSYRGEEPGRCSIGCTEKGFDPVVVHPRGVPGAAKLWGTHGKLSRGLQELTILEASPPSEHP